MKDDRIKNLMELIRIRYDFSDYIWEIEEVSEVCLDFYDEVYVNDESVVIDESVVNDEAVESDEDYYILKGLKNLGVILRRGKKRFSDYGMEKRKYKVFFFGFK